MAQRTIQLREYQVAATEETRVDRDQCVIHGVKVLGEQSKNRPPHNHVYPRETRERAIPLFEGITVYIDHPPKNVDGSVTRGYNERNGKLRNVRESGTGLVADYHLNPEHPTTKQILWDAENAPDFGFSINGRGRDRVQRDGSVLIEEIPQLYSVDLVSRPATTKGLYEHELENQPVSKKTRELIESLKSTRPGYAKALREMVEAGLLSPDSEVSEPAPADAPTEAMDHVDALNAGFESAVMAVFREEGTDMKSKLGKIRDILAAQEKLLGGGTPEPEEGPKGDGEEEDDDDDEGKKTEESLKTAALEAGQKALREELLVRDQIADAGLTFKSPAARKAFVKSLIPLTESERKAMIDERLALLQESAKPGGQKPRSAAPWQDPTTGGNGKPVREAAAGDSTIDDSEESRRKRVAELRSTR